MGGSMADEREKGTEERRPKHRLRRFLLFVLILAAVLAVVVVAAYRDGTGFDVLRRFVTYGSVEKSGGEVSYTYDAASSNRFAALGDSLAVLSGTELQVLSGDGTAVYTANVKMAQPALNAGGGCAVAVDVGGTSLYVVDAKGLVFSLTADEDEPFLSAELNAQGWLAVTAEKKNYKACVSVYNEKRELVFSFNSSQRFVSDAWVTDDCKHLAAVTLGQKDSVFLSSLVFYDLDATDPVGSCDVSDGLALRLGEVSGRLAAVCDTCLAFTDAKDGKPDLYPYNGAFLREYDLGGDGFAMLLLNRYRSGNVGRLVTVDSSGKEIASLDVNEEIRSVSASGRYIAVLGADRLVIYNRELQQYASLSGTGYAKSVLMRADGSALLIASDRAHLFLP
jgi:hypothetical protein